MAVLKIGNLTPNFTLLSQDENEVSLKDFRAKYVVLYPSERGTRL